MLDWPPRINFTADITNTSFIDSHAGKDGEVIHVTSSSINNFILLTVKINLIMISFGFDTNEGEVIFIYGSELNIIDTTIFNNSADLGIFYQCL